MIPLYDSVEEFQQKLGNSVVLFENRPVYIASFNGNKKNIHANFLELPADKEKLVLPSSSVSVTDSGWDFKFLGEKLGYSSVQNTITKDLEVVWTTRIPIRHSRQGLDNKTVGIKTYPENKFPFDWFMLINSSGFLDTMENKYPKKEDAFNLLTQSNSHITSLAIGRKYALTYNKVSPPLLIYRGEAIAYTEDGKAFKLAKHKEFMKEELVDIEGFNIL